MAAIRGSSHHRPEPGRYRGDLRAAGALRSLYTRQVDLRLLKDRLPEASFGQGALAWSALVA